MTKKIKCELQAKAPERVKVRIIKAPIVDSRELKSLIFFRGRALVL